MSSRAEATTPQPDREAISPSPARNALQSNLESGLTLTRKKSWFGSAREWASRGAHHAKGYFDKQDSVKGETSRDRQLTLDRPHEDGLLSPDLECSDDDNAATSFKPTPLRHRTFTPKNAMASLRQHTQSTKGKHKRGTMSDIHRPEIGSPAESHTPTPADDAPKGHTSKPSVAKSLVGSMRGFGRRANAARTISPEKLVEQRESSSSSAEAAFVPLPSSPINITPLPTLSLDLPPSALVPDCFGRTPPDSDTELMRLTDPINVASARPVPTYYTRIPDEGPVDQLNLAIGLGDKTCTPRDYLGLQADNLGPVGNPGPPTPMPGANCSLELDGTSLPGNKSAPPVQIAPHHGRTEPTGLDGANDETELFERNVEYKDETKKKENRTLKKRVSLDAMAEECAGLSPNQQLSATHRNVSDVTIKECPDDMPPLTRQWANLQTPSAGHRCPQTGDWKSEDPFAPGNAVGDLAVDGPPAIGAQVILPLRPKITLQSADSAEPRTLNDNDDPILADRANDASNLSGQPAATGGKPQVCEWSDIEMPPHSNPSFALDTTSVLNQNTAPVEATSMSNNLENEAAVRPQTPANGASPQERMSDTDSGKVCDPLDVNGQSSGNTAEGFVNDEQHIAYEPSIDGSDQDSMHGPVHRKSSVMQIYELLTKTQTPSPKRVGTGIAVSNSATAFWKFRHWNVSPPRTKQTHHNDANNESVNAAKDDPLPPRRRSSDLDVEPSESGRSPDARSTSSALDDGGSPSMGDRVKFDVDRAGRAERYAALVENPNRAGGYDAVVFEDTDSAQAPSPRRPVLSDKTNVPEAGPSAEDGSAKPRSRRDSAHESCYSVDSDLQADLAGVYELQNAMAGTSFDPNPVVVENSSPATPMPSSGQPLLRSDADGCDDHDGPQRTTDYPASSPLEDTPALSPGEKKFWRDVQDCPFGTPQQTPGESPTQSLHKRQSTAIVGTTPCTQYPGDIDTGTFDGALVLAEEFLLDDLEEDVVQCDPEQTLDEGLQLYHSFTSNPDMRYSDTPTMLDHDSPAKNPIASPDSGYEPDQSSDVEELPSSPTEQRSRNTTIANSSR